MAEPRLFIERSEHVEYLFDKLREGPRQVLISSFGVYAGFTYDGRDTTEWGKKYALATRDMLEEMRGIQGVRMLIGVAKYRSCKGFTYCRDCEINYVRQLFRVAFHAEHFPEFQWRICTELHLKCALFFYDNHIEGVAGGRNFTDSSWADVTVELTRQYARRLANHTMELWNRSWPVGEEAINKILESEGISNSTLRFLDAQTRL